MISFPLLLLLLGNFIAIGLLPILFFRRDGKFNLRWIATGAPFFVVPAIVLCGCVGLLDPLYGTEAGMPFASRLVAVLLSAGSIALIVSTISSHRVPLALWHQDNDAPVQLVTWGPYARVRHPFYTSFILAFVAAVAAFPHALTIASLAYGVTALSVTARREERRLSESEFGDAYREYMNATGRFFPGVG